MIKVSPFSRVTMCTPGGIAGIAVLVSLAVVGLKLSIIRRKDTSNTAEPSLNFRQPNRKFPRSYLLQISFSQKNNQRNGNPFPQPPFAQLTVSSPRER